MVVIELEEGSRYSRIATEIHKWRINHLNREDITVEFINGNPKENPLVSKMDELTVKHGSKVLLHVSFPKIYWWVAADA